MGLGQIFECTAATDALELLAPNIPTDGQNAAVVAFEAISVSSVKHAGGRQSSRRR